MVEIQQKIEEALVPILATRDAYCVYVHVHNERRGKLVQVYVDTDEGITIEACAQISRELSSVINANSLIHGTYRIEVSSPGVGQPLRLLRQYRKRLGKKMRIKHRIEGEVVVTRAVLEAVHDDRLSFIDEKNNRLVLTQSEILEAREELPW